MPKTVYDLVNCTNQMQEFPVGRKKLRPGEHVRVSEAHYHGVDVQRVLAQGRFTMVNRVEIQVSPPHVEAPEPGVPPRKTRKTKRQSTDD